MCPSRKDLSASTIETLCFWVGYPLINFYQVMLKLLNPRQDHIFADNEIADYMEGYRIRWLFNLLWYPWAGGIFGRMVRSVKGCLQKVLGNARMTEDELYTILTKIECALNSRPLTFQ